MRVFANYRELQTAIDAGSFRFSAEYFPAGFVCACCKQTIAFQTSGGTGYGLNDADEMHCYPCSTANDVQRMATRPARFTGYISSEQPARFTSWPGGLLGHVVSHSSHRNNWGARIHCYCIRDLHGQYWHGRNSGPGMCITIRPAKGA